MVTRNSDVTFYILVFYFYRTGRGWPLRALFLFRLSVGARRDKLFIYLIYIQNTIYKGALKSLSMSGFLS